MADASSEQELERVAAERGGSDLQRPLLLHEGQASDPPEAASHEQLLGSGGEDDLQDDAMLLPAQGVPERERLRRRMRQPSLFVAKDDLQRQLAAMDKTQLREAPLPAFDGSAEDMAAVAAAASAAAAVAASPRKPSDFSVPLGSADDETAGPASAGSGRRSVVDRRRLSRQGDYGVGTAPPHVPSWEFPGWGSTFFLTMPADDDGAPAAAPAPGHLLGQFYATAICGNDITASCLYTVGLASAAAGVWAPLTMLMICFMLYLFRSVYGEVCTALPLNGGAYNALLNTSSKSTASLAACLTILSYVATAVVSASSAISYLQRVWEVPYTGGTVLLLALFAVLALVGMSESAVVAAVIFFVHCSTLLLLIVVGVVHLGQHGFSQLHDNYASTEQETNIGKALLFGYAASALGITGFETSANFVEEQKPGVFVKTLRNMWVAVLLFNPTLSFLTLSALPLADVHANKDTVLALLGRRAAGAWLDTWVSVDAFLVLSGSIITSFVGVTGLARRLAGDRCLPAFLLSTNKMRGTPHWIIVVFFVICTSMFLLLQGNVDSLSGVYTLSFLSVMLLFALGDMMLKYKRSVIPREVVASWPTVMTAFVLGCVALGGSIAFEPDNVSYFLIYFCTTAFIFYVTLHRIELLRMVLFFVRRLSGAHKRSDAAQGSCDKAVVDLMSDIKAQSCAFFASSDDLSLLNKAILYIRENEHTQVVRVVHVTESGEPPPRFVQHVAMLDAMYPKVKIDAVIVRGRFGRAVVDAVSEAFGIPKNLCFIASPGSKFAVRLASLGGVRVITH